MPYPNLRWTWDVLETLNHFKIHEHIKRIITEHAVIHQATNENN